MIIQDLQCPVSPFSHVSNSDSVDIHAEEERKENSSKILQTI